MSPRSESSFLGEPCLHLCRHFPSETPCCQAADPLGTATITDFCQESHCGRWEGQLISLWLLHLKCSQDLPTDSWQRFISNLTLPEFSCRGGKCMGTKQLVRTYSWDSCWRQPASSGRAQLPSMPGSPPQGSLSPPSPYQGDCWL